MPFPQPAHVGTNTTMTLVTKGEANYTRSSWVGLPQEAKHYIQKLLKVKMSERFSIKEALQLKKNTPNFRVNREMREKIMVYNPFSEEF